MCYNSTPMKKIFFLILLSLIFTPNVYAKSSATVKVNNDVSSSSNTNSTIKTDIRIETNGNVTTYSSDKPGNIEIRSVDGTSQIKVNSKVVNSEEPSKDNNKQNKDIDKEKNKNEDSNTKEIKNKFFGLLKLPFDLFTKIFFFLR